MICAKTTNLKTIAWLLIGSILTSWQITSSSAWLSSSGWSWSWGGVHRSSLVQGRSQLFQSSNPSSSAESDPVEMRRQRASIEGVSLAPTGFWAMLRVAQDGYLPWQVTNDPQDSYAATSPEALTLIQLLSGVDMAGAILPPDVLARLVVLHCEELLSESVSSSAEQEMIVAQDILNFVQESLPNATVSYSQAHPWFQSRVKLPTASLDEVLINTKEQEENAGTTFSLTCSVRNFGTLTFTPTNEMLETVLYQFSEQTSLAFISLALALRYQAPVSVLLPYADNDEQEQEQQQQPGNNNMISILSLDQLQQRFPMYATVSSLQKSSNRVQENIVRGFEIHKLQGALRIAMERGDHEAVAKIRETLDEYDSMDQLPTANFEQEDGGLLQRNCTMSDVMQ